jgi:Ca-activated chloride channel family protein
MRFVKYILLSVFLFNFTVIILAQDKDTSKEDEVLRIETQLVDVPIIVTDKSGKPLLNLKKNNFVVYEDGKKQELSDFAATSAPFEVALLLDTSGSTRSDLALIQRAAESFINSLRPGDRVSIVAFKSYREGNKSIAVSEVLTLLTDDRNKLKNALANVKTSNGTPYYDGLLQVVEKVFREIPKDEFRGRRALVALTDGVDSTSVAGFDEVSEEFGQAGIVSYFIQVDTREFFEENLLGDCDGAMRFSQAQIRRYYRTFYPKSKIEKVFNFCNLGDFERLDISKRLYGLADAEMQSLAKMSGGKVFLAADLSEARGAFTKVAQEIGTKYSLGYYSTNEKRDGSYRKIKIELKGIPAGAQIRAREGYTAPIN